MLRRIVAICMAQQFPVVYDSNRENQKYIYPKHIPCGIPNDGRPFDCNKNNSHKSTKMFKFMEFSIHMYIPEHVLTICVSLSQGKFGCLQFVQNQIFSSKNVFVLHIQWIVYLSNDWHAIISKIIQWITVSYYADVSMNLAPGIWFIAWAIFRFWKCDRMVCVCIWWFFSFLLVIFKSGIFFSFFFSLFLSLFVSCLKYAKMPSSHILASDHLKHLHDTLYAHNLYANENSK